MGRLTRKVKQAIIRVELLVKVNPGEREMAERVILGKLNSWFDETVMPPYGSGALLRYEIDPELHQGPEINPQYESHCHVRFRTE